MARWESDFRQVIVYLLLWLGYYLLEVAKSIDLISYDSFMLFDKSFQQMRIWKEQNLAREQYCY